MGKKKKGNRRGAFDDDDDDVAVKSGKKGQQLPPIDGEDVDNQEPSQQSASQSRKNKKKNRQQKKQNAANEDRGAPAKSKRQELTLDPIDDEDEEEDEFLGAMAAKKKKNNKKKSKGPVNAFALLDDDDDDDEEEADEQQEDDVDAGDEDTENQQGEEDNASEKEEEEDDEKSTVSAPGKEEEDTKPSKPAASSQPKSKNTATSGMSEAVQEILSLQQQSVAKGSASNSEFIRIEKFDISFPKKILFKNASLELHPGRKYGLVSPNGVGKSTLLHYVVNRKDDFAQIPSHFDIHLVEQEVRGDDTSALQAVINADQERLRLLREEQLLMNLSEEDEEQVNFDVGDRLRDIYDRLDAIDAYSAEGRASSILTGLQFSEEMKQQKTSSFSGGWRMRIALARALFRQPTLLLLDEPTNHLDLLAVLWLETYLQKWKKMLLIVSHDQHFLNSVCTEIIHIRQQNLEYYKGDYDKFKKQFEDKKALERKNYEKYLKQQKQLKADKGKQDKKAAEKKGKDAAKVLRNKQLAQQGKGKNKKMTADERAEAEEKMTHRPEKDYNVNFQFPEPDKLSIPVIQVKDATFGYSRDKILFRDLEFGVDQDSRIVLVGANGSGKSTILKLLEGNLEPLEGSIERNRRLKIGRFNQHFVDKLDYDETPIGYLQRKFKDQDLKEQQIRAMLGRFGLTGVTHIQKINSLSGGQKSRVVLAEICMSHPHLLFLDEPTNHLDIESIDALADALNEYKGGLVLVTHDARLIENVCESVWVCDSAGDQTVEDFDGDFDDYRDMVLDEFAEKLRQEEEERAEKEQKRKIEREKIRAEKAKQLEEKKKKKNADKK